MAADPALHAPDAAREPPSAADARRVRAALDRALATDATLADFDAVRADVAAMLPPPPVDRARDAVDAWERDGASPPTPTVRRPSRLKIPGCGANWPR